MSICIFGPLNTIISGNMYLIILEILLFLCFLFLIAFLPAGYWGVGRLRENAALKDSLTKIYFDQQQSEHELLENKINQEFDKAWRKKEASTYFFKKIFSAIDYGIKRHDWYEDQRARIFQVSIALLSAVLAILAITSKLNAFKQGSNLIIVIFLGLLTLVSFLRMVYLYNKELDADRPYRLISDIRFWYYRYNLPKLGGKNITVDNALNAANTVSNEREKFFNRLMENLNLKSSIREDIEQIFILHVLQRYKSESLTKMRWVLSYFLIFGVIQVFIFIAMQWLTQVNAMGL